MANAASNTKQLRWGQARLAQATRPVRLATKNCCLQRNNSVLQSIVYSPASTKASSIPDNMVIGTIVHLCVEYANPD